MPTSKRDSNPQLGCARITAQAVIAVSLWGLAGGGSIIFLRVFRAFRVMRLFKKLQPMRKILISLGACFKPVFSAFVMLFILASVYSQVIPLGELLQR